MEYTFSDEYKDGPLSLGMHKRNRFYEVVNTKYCNIVHEDFNTIMDFTRRYFDGKLKPYHKIRHTGNLRHLMLRRNLEGEVLVNLVTTWEEADYKEYFSKLQHLPIEGKIVGIIHTLNDSPSDAIVPEKTEIIYGRDYLTEKISGLEFKISLYSFFQTNTHSAKRLYQLTQDMIEDIAELNLLDLYSGTGTITQIVGQRAKSALGIEIVEEAVNAARENAKINEISNVEFICGDVFEETKNLEYKPDIVIIDPPREGINPRAIDKIIEFAVEKYLYISCNPITLVRDLKIFREKGYEIKELKILDQFPRTYHVETVALLSKLNTEHHLDIEIGEDELSEIDFSKEATYGEIKKYVLDKYGLKVSSLYIAQVKRKHGLIERENYNTSKNKNQRVPNCPEEKEKAIEDALEYFGMI
ncbi:23S rRNA methyluridine methyltransferase [Peptoniphilus sp. ING2-D1G]|nr:23S rRNA methyluridine methyltransferase [Peptoniphilus sp. ING2-D1G]